jgi:hypothetical protein
VKVHGRKYLIGVVLEVETSMDHHLASRGVLMVSVSMLMKKKLLVDEMKIVQNQTEQVEGGEVVVVQGAKPTSIDTHS